MERELAVHTLGLTKRYGRTLALDQVELCVPTGAVYGLLGRNGAGKTTMLSLLVNLIAPSAGSLEVLGYDPTRQAPEMLRHVGYVPAGHPFYGWMTVREAMRFVSGFHQQWDDALVRGLLAQSKVGEKDRIDNLSRGMRALLSVALAVGHRPRLVLMDEAFEGLDVVVRREIMRMLIEMVQQHGATVLATGHEVSDLERICDHVGIISQGRLLVQETMEQLKATYGPQDASLEDIFVRLVGQETEAQ